MFELENLVNTLLLDVGNLQNLAYHQKEQLSRQQKHLVHNSILQSRSLSKRVSRTNNNSRGEVEELDFESEP